MRVQSRVGVQPRCLVGWRSVSLLSRSVLRIESSMPLIAISRDLMPFDKPAWKSITQKCLLLSSAPVHLWAPERSRIFDTTIQDFSWGSNTLHPSDAACPSEATAIVINVKEPAVFMRKQSSRMSQTVIPAADARIFV
jgi:hypothetical protein